MPRTKKTETQKKTTEKPVVKQDGLSIPVYGLDGAVQEHMKLPEEMFSIAKPASKNLITQYIRVYTTNQRQGTVATKTRGEVVGTTKKVYRQKGTGGARHGSRKAPIFVGGGVTFGPQPREFSLKINKKQKQKVFYSILSSKFKSGNIYAVADEVMTMEPKTKNIAGLFNKIDSEKKKTLVLLTNENRNNVVRASGNIPYINTVSATQVNAYQLLQYKNIVFVKSAVEEFKKHFTKAV